MLQVLKEDLWPRLPNLSENLNSTKKQVSFILFLVSLIASSQLINFLIGDQVPINVPLFYHGQEFLQCDVMVIMSDVVNGIYHSEK